MGAVLGIAGLYNPFFVSLPWLDLGGCSKESAEVSQGIQIVPFSFVVLVLCRKAPGNRGFFVPSSSMNLHRWERAAAIIYSETQWEKAALSAGKAMDNRLNTIARDLFGQEAESGSFDIAQWLAWFDPEVLKQRGLWHILQKGVIYVNEQTDIYQMFNPGDKL